MPRIVTVTLNPAVDEYTRVDRVLPARKLRCDAPRSSPGGGGINVARMIANLGGDAVALWSRAGTEGARLAELLEEYRVDHRPVDLAGHTRVNLTVQERGEDSSQYRFTMPGPELDDDGLAAWTAAIRDLDPPPDYLVCSGSLPPGAPEDTYAHLARAAGDGCKVVVDTSSAALTGALAEPVFLVSPNRRELAEVCERELAGDREIRDAAAAFRAEHPVEVVVVTLSEGGALLLDGDGARHLRAPTVTVRSHIAAGDCAIAGIVFAHARGDPIADAMRYGIACGAAAVTTPDGELCGKDLVDRLHADLREAGG